MLACAKYGILVGGSTKQDKNPIGTLSIFHDKQHDKRNLTRGNKNQIYFIQCTGKKHFQNTFGSLNFAFQL